MNDTLKNFVMQTLSGSKGRIASFVSALVVGALVRTFAEHNLTLTPQMTDTLTVGVVGFVAWVIDATVLQLNALGIKQIQAALPADVKIDGYAGTKTIEAVQDATGVTSPAQTFNPIITGNSFVTQVEPPVDPPKAG